MNQEDEALVGKPFAESLGLPTIEKLSDGCMYAAQAPPDQTLYCLDGVADNYVEARLLGYRVNGHVPTELEEQFAVLLAEEEAILATDNQARLDEIRDQIVEVVKQINLAKNAGQ